MAINYEKSNVRDREHWKFRDHSDDDKVKVGVEVENDISNPIPVYITDSSGDTKINEFGSVSAIANAVLTTIVTYTVPATKTFYLELIECGGENIARWDILLDSVLIARKRTWFAEGLSLDFIFNKYEISSGSLIEVKVYHIRPNSGDFESRIVGTLV